MMSERDKVVEGLRQILAGEVQYGADADTYVSEAIDLLCQDEAALAVMGRFTVQQGLGWQQRAESAEAKLARMRALPHLVSEHGGWRVFLGELPYCYHVMRGAAEKCVRQISEAIDAALTDDQPGADSARGR